MIPSLPVQKTQNNLVKVSLALGLFSIVAAALFHFFLYLFSGILDNTIINVFISFPIVTGMISIVIGIISLGQIMNRNIFGKEKAIVGILLGSVIVIGLIIFLLYFFSIL